MSVTATSDRDRIQRQSSEADDRGGEQRQDAEAVINDGYQRQRRFHRFLDSAWGSAPKDRTAVNTRGRHICRPYKSFPSDCRGGIYPALADVRTRMKTSQEIYRACLSMSHRRQRRGSARNDRHWVVPTEGTLASTVLMSSRPEEHSDGAEGSMYIG